MTSVLNANNKVGKPGASAKVEVKTNDPLSPPDITAKKCNGKRKSASLPSETVEYLKAWMMSPEHIAHPYPTEQEKVEIMKDTNIELKQLTNWFVNNRKRYWKPRVEARLQQQAQAAQAAVQAHAAAVAVANSLPQQRQVLATSSPEVTRANLVSPTVMGYKYASQSPLTYQANIPPFMTFKTFSSPSPSIQQQSFDSSPLAFAAQIVELQRKPIVSVPATSTVRAVNGCAPSSSSAASVSASEPSSSSAASVSASEGESSDSGNTSDDASSDGATILGTDLKFIDLKMKKKFRNKRTSSTISSMPFLPESPQQKIEIRARNVSFCSLDKVSLDVASNSTPQEFQDTSSAGINKKRSLVADNDEEYPFVVATTDSTSNPAPERKRSRTVSVDVWRTKCQDATNMNDEALPSLEEACRLFGFTSA